MTPTQKMNTQVTVTLTPAERARAARHQQTQVAAARARGQRVTALPIPKSVNVPIGFGGAASIEQRMAALDRAEALARAKYAKAHPPQPTQLEFARAYATMNGQANFPDAVKKVRAYNAVSHGPNLLRGIITGVGMLPVHAIEGAGRTLQDIGVGISHGARGYGPGTPEQVKRASELAPNIARVAGANTIGPSITSLIQGGHPSLAGLGVDAALLLPMLKPFRGLKVAIDAARAAKVEREAAALRDSLHIRLSENQGKLRDAIQNPTIDQPTIDALNAERDALTAKLDQIDNPALIPERQTQIEEWKRLGWTDKQIESVLAFHDNQAALDPRGPREFWQRQIGHPSGETPAQQTARGAQVLHQHPETPQAARAKTRARIQDAGRPPNAAWRDRHEIPHHLTRKGFVDLEPVAAAAREPHIPDIVFPPEESRKRLIAKLFPGKGSASGIPTTRDIWKVTEDGQRYKIAGNVTPQDWVERVRAVVRDPALIDALAHWYTIYKPTFTRAFGADAPEIMRAFAVSQANASPASGMTAVFKVMDRLAKGDPLTRNEYSVVGLNIQKAMQDGEIDSHVAAKLSDFVDSLAGRDTRSWMNHDPRAGSPVAVDVHAVRDRGFIDKKLQAKVEAAGFKLGKDFHLEGNGTAQGALYERISEWYHEISDHLNEIHFNGRNDWTPSQAQALGWSTIQKAHGVIPEGFAEAFGYNTRDIGFEVTRGAGNLGADLTPKQARQVARAMVPHARALAEDIPGIYVRDVRVGLGGWNQGSNPMITVEVMGSKQAVQDSLPHFAQAFDQEWVQASREVSGKDSRAALIIDSPKFKDPRTVARFWKILNRIEPKLEGFMPYDAEGIPAIAIRTTSRSVSPKTAEAFISKYRAAIIQAERESGIELGYQARNIELLTGGQHGYAAPLQTLPGSGGGRYLGALEHPRSAGIRDTLEREIERARAGEPPGRPAARGGEPGDLVGAPGSRLHQLDPQTGQPLGATEFLGEGATRTHYFAGATPGTAMHELLHVSIQGLKGRHFLTLADEFAGGKVLADWTRDEHEAVAAAFDHWLETGEIKNSKLKGAFQAIKDWMGAMIGKAKASGYQLPADVEDAFNFMFREPHAVPLEKQAVAAARRSGRVYAAQEIERSVERSRRVGNMVAAREAEGGGLAGQRAALEALTGEYPKVPFLDLAHLQDHDVEYLIDAAVAGKKLRPFEETRLAEAIKKAQGGEVFTPSDAKLVIKAFGEPKAGGANLTLGQRAVQVLAEIINIPRSVMASFDVSGFLRQALVAFAMHPVMVTKEVGPMLKYLISEEKYLADMGRLRSRPDVHLLEGGGMDLTDLEHVFGREESFQSNLAEQISGSWKHHPLHLIGVKHGPIRASGRAYTGLLNNVRVALGEHMLELERAANGTLSPESIKSAAKVANWATGRGHLGEHETAATLLNTIFFSPRLLKSRLDFINVLPGEKGFYSTLEGAAKREAYRGAINLLVGGLAILGAAKASGQIDVGLNPFSSDFGKLKVGNTRIDIWGGHQQVVRMLAQAIAGKKTSAVTGVTKDIGHFKPPLDFVRGKLSPPFAIMVDEALGKTMIGKPFSWNNVWKNNLIPLVFQDTWQAYQDKHNIPWAALMYALGEVGVGTQTFGPAEDSGGGAAHDPFAINDSGSHDPFAIGDAGTSDPFALP